VLYKWLNTDSTKAALLSNLVLFSPFINAFDESSIFSIMPEKVTNNAVTQVAINNDHYFLSFSGLGTNKTYQDVHNKSFAYSTKQQTWQKISPVPLSSNDLNSTNNLVGRLASVATSINDTAYLFGGYTVAKDHSEVSISDVYSYHLLTDKYNLLAPMPVPVDDSVALPFHQNSIYLVSGWHNSGNVNLVQLYNTQTNQWQQATPFPGKPVFGHAGGIVGNKMLICDGVAIKVHEKARRTYQDEAACYLGEIDANQPNRIDWHIIKHPTGNARYRMASIGITHEQKIVFVGGSDNPYNYNGIGYNGIPSQPSDEIWFYDLNSRQWQIQKSKTATMDHRGLVLFKNELLTIGGMTVNQQVLNSINVYSVKK
jgi:N-acetylneuraminic acid mutarotase